MLIRNLRMRHPLQMVGSAFSLKKGVLQCCACLQIRTAKSTIEETCSKADTELEKLSRLKHSTEKAVRELEIRAIAACTGADTLAELGPKGTKQANNAVLLLQKKEHQLRNAMQATKEKVCMNVATLDDTNEIRIPRHPKTMFTGHI